MNRLKHVKNSLFFMLLILGINLPKLALAQAPTLSKSSLEQQKADAILSVSNEELNYDKEKLLELNMALIIEQCKSLESSNRIAFEAANRTSEFIKTISLNNTNQNLRIDGPTFIVNTTDDTSDVNIADSVCADANGNCSLRAAIENANKMSDKNAIHFNISGTAPFTIVIENNQLPAIGYPIIIDGRTQSEYTISNTPVIEIDGSTLPINNSGLRVYGYADNSEIYGLSIGGFQRLNVSPYTGGFAIDVFSESNIIQSNYIGLKPDGNTLNPNNWGVYFYASANNIVGGVGAHEGNVISGNYSGGITFDSSDSSNNIVQGNLLGTDATGLLARGNRFNLQLLNAPNNLIGGSTPEARNVISAGDNNNPAVVDGTGISITGADATSNTIIGNYIGTDITGNTALPNARGGILLLFGANGNNIGGAATGEGNLISGNNHGIYMQGSEAGNAVSYNIISGNLIGTNASGNQALPNIGGIVMLTGENIFNTIGGSDIASRNIISGNTYDGVSLNSGSNNTIRNNYIGLDISGSNSIGNNQSGVYVNSNNNIITSNVISGNGNWGVYLSGASSYNALKGNSIGTDLNAANAMPNLRGVEIRGSENFIGGNNTSDRNIISGNTSYGINILSSSAINNKITGNYIGTNITGTTALPNSTGVRIFEASLNTVGGSYVAERNIISGNTTEGILIASALSENNQIKGNYIGTDVTGTIALPNSRGLRIVSAVENTIGGTDAFDGNIISGNSWDGVVLLTATNNSFFGNKIGVQANGISALANGQTGVQILNGSIDNTIGGINNGEANTIAYNTNKGVSVFKVSAGGYPDVEPTGNVISGNRIFNNTSNVSTDGATGAGIDLNSDGISLNDPDDPDLGANNTQNFPVIDANSATVDAGVITLSYSIPSTPVNSAYPIQVEFFIDDTKRQGKEFLFVDTYSEADYNQGTSKTISKTIPSGSSFVIEQKILAVSIDANGNTSECSVPEIVLEENLSIENQHLDNIAVYPNPVSDLLNIKIKQTISSIELYSILGHKIFQSTTNVNQLDVSNYQSGVYLLKIITDKGRFIKKIVIK